ncbi:type II toxin-antitoxin system RnlB family antitoxin [Desulfobacula sp.]|uniref:type II toxin-antitoxin system RnlB family antitoxin n=1 Tax=Desulfobacula sp. TaxID=2593537 RepID=UPI0025C3AE3A|nr:type II toxin-antitoxin system RnlB family antitoxin [Desulfobacula sp.]MBC2705956.1 type II toxin-antitoxin system RnlB family antitoxin [Desulfobacula sp.]
MIDFEIKKINEPEYECIVWATNYKNPLDNLEDIEKILKIKQCTGRILFDFLLSNGVNSDRFFECPFDGNKLQPFKIKRVETKGVSKVIQKLSLNFLSKTKFIEKSVLTKAERFLLRKKRLFNL